MRRNRLQVEPACCWDERRAVAWAFAHTLRSDVVSELKVSPGSALPCPPPQGPILKVTHADNLDRDKTALRRDKTTILWSTAVERLKMCVKECFSSRLALPS